MTNLTKAYLDMFIALALLISFGQDIYKISTTNSIDSSINNQNLNEGVPNNQTNPDNNSIPELKGVVIQVTDGMRKPLQDLLKAQKYNVKVQGYKFEGSDWWFETAINYGHIILVYMLMSKYKTQTNEQTKKKIMWGGGLAVLAWFFIMPMFKQNKLAIEIKGVKTYESTGFVANEIISAIADQVDIAELTQQSLDDQF